MARCSLFVQKVPLNTPTNCAKVDVWLVQIEEAERRQQLLVDILRKEQEHRQRLVSLSFVRLIIAELSFAKYSDYFVHTMKILRPFCNCDYIKSFSIIYIAFLHLCQI